MVRIQKMKAESCGFDLFKPIQIYETTYVWSSDGWVYDLTAKIRRKFSPTEDPNIFDMEQEKYETVVLDSVESREQVTVYLFSKTEARWMEKSASGCKVYASV